MFVSFEREAKELGTKIEAGAIGVDINEKHLAITEVDRFGNKRSSRDIKLNLYGKSKALIGDAIKEVIQLAKESKLPIVVEELDFKKKKQSLKESNPRYARMLSSFSYRKILENFESKAFKEGVEIIHISPAYTSMIGAIKYKKNYGLSTHASAAVCIARRSMGYLENFPLVKK